MQVDKKIIRELYTEAFKQFDVRTCENCGVDSVECKRTSGIEFSRGMDEKEVNVYWRCFLCYRKLMCTISKNQDFEKMFRPEWIWSNSDNTYINALEVLSDQR